MRTLRSHGSILNTQYYILLLCITTRCVEPYQPSASATNLNYLVVDSFINLTDGSTSVTLSRTSAPSAPDKINTETGAVIQLEDDSGASISIPEQSNGTYTATIPNLSLSKKYRLHITAAGKEYTSDYVTPKQTPPIDTVAWQPSRDGVQITINTHDPTDNSRYYHWNYVETWEYYSHFSSAYEVSDGTIIPRSLAHQIHRCWNTQPADHIISATTVRLSHDVVAGQQLALIPAGSQKLLIQYSMLVTQQSIGQSEYDYWQQLQKTTENLGGLFDPLPAQVTGNFHALKNPDEPVIGYFSLGTISTKRIFILFNQLPQYLQYGPQQETCELQELSRNFFLTNQSNYPIVDIKGNGSSFVVSTPYCVDCRIQGGINIKPDFWK